MWRGWGREGEKSEKEEEKEEKETEGEEKEKETEEDWFLCLIAYQPSWVI